MNNELITMARDEYLKKYFPIVDPKQLSMDDAFIKDYRPDTYRQRRKYEEIVETIQIGVPKFRAQVMDPSIDENNNIFYGEGNKPAVGKSPEWWLKKALEFMPEKNSQIGTKQQRNILLCFLIKKLSEEKSINVSDAWYMVCDNSRDIGLYFNSNYSRARLGKTGERNVAGFFDWVNTIKFVQSESMIFVEGGGFMLNSYDYPLISSEQYFNTKKASNYAVGWITMDP